MLTLRLIVPLFVIALTTSTLRADSVVSIQLPQETATYRAGNGVELAQNLCITCHSADYASMQPPMPRKFWEGTIKKMKDKFAAPIPDEMMAKLADYFTASYGVETPVAK